MDSNREELKKAFYAQLTYLQAHSLPKTTSTLSLLTKEELLELESVWIELSVWKKKQDH